MNMAQAECDTESGVLVTLTFQRGRLGLEAEWTTGLVQKVQEGGQADNLGIKEGWQFVAIGEDPYDESALRGKVADAEPFMVTFLTKQPGRALILLNEALNSHNVWAFSIEPSVIDEAARLFKDDVLPAYLSAKQEGLVKVDDFVDGFKVAYRRLQTDTGSRFLISHPLTFPGDLVYVQADDESTYRRFESLFHQSGLIEKCMPIVDHSSGLRLFSCNFVVRSVVHGHNWHYDYDLQVGTDAVTLMTPVTPVHESGQGFHFLYRSLDGELQTYTYRRGEGIVFGAGFLHSSEPGESSEPWAFLCFYFGTDRQELWPSISKGLTSQTGFVCRPDGRFMRTELGRMVEIVEHLRGTAA
mmetsp:Transcript_156850/g.481120  ORF Transcript_156850/g.481120 Transcript_156850/m.481120 type:complete len:356 (-) Transcript_156850:69-1136(-)